MFRQFPTFNLWIAHSTSRAFIIYILSFMTYEDWEWSSWMMLARGSHFLWRQVERWLCTSSLHPHLEITWVSCIYQMRIKNYFYLPVISSFICPTEKARLNTPISDIWMRERERGIKRWMSIYHNYIYICIIYTIFPVMTLAGGDTAHCSSPGV